MGKELEKLRNMKNEELPLGLDHVGLILRNLEAGRATYERLGFQLTPKSTHSGSREPGGPVEHFGSGNHCAMFKKGYFEVMGLTDPDLYSTARTLLKKYEGLHIIAFDGADAETNYRILSRRFDGVEAPKRLEREVNTDSHQKEPSRAVFNNVTLDPALFPEAKIIFIEHVTRELLWQPEWMEHPNGTLSLDEVALCVEDIDAVSAKFSRLLNCTPSFPTTGVSQFKLAEGKVYIMNPATVTKWIPGVAPPSIPSVVGVGFRVRNLDTTRRLLDMNSVAYQSHSYPGIWIHPEITGGAVISFMQFE